MTARESLRTSALTVGGAIAAAVLFYHAHHLGQQATVANAEAVRTEQQAAQLQSFIRRGVPSEPAATQVTEATVCALSSLRDAAALTHISIGQVSVSGAVENGGSNLQNIAAAARPAQAVGLRRIEVTLAGGWQTLADMEHLLDAIADQPVRIKGLNLGKDYFRITLDVYGR